MIRNLRVGKTANFFALKERLSARAIDDLFRDLRAGQRAASRYLFDHRRERAHRATWSALSFSYEREPGFLMQAAGVKDRVHGYLMLVEYREHIAVFKSRLDVPASFATRFFERVPTDQVDTAITRGGAIFEKIRLRNMSLSKSTLRTKTLEADDLRNIVGPAGASRLVPQAYNVRKPALNYSATPRTGRISQRSDLVDHAELIGYAKFIIDELLNLSGEAAPFILAFARAVDLSALDTAPCHFAVDVAGLADAIYEYKEVRFVRQNEGTYVELSKAEVDAVLAELDTVLGIQGAGKLLDVIRRDSGAKVGAIAINKSRIALRDLRMPIIGGIEVESTKFAVGKDPERQGLRHYLDRENRFIILFANLSLAYIDGTLFRDDAMVGGGSEFLRHLHVEPLLSQVNDEKGHFAAGQIDFDPNSTFGAIVASVANGDGVLVCDDLGDEWADFIGLSNNSNPPRITFYHAKHGDPSLGAGPFHVSVSQAIKNLGRMSLPADTIGSKIASWKRPYVSGTGVNTSIARIVRGAPHDIRQEFESARTAPDAIRRAFIVTSSLSRSAVKHALDDVSRGNAPDPYFVQLYWLLQSFFSACTEVGAHGYVICRA